MTSTDDPIFRGYAPLMSATRLHARLRQRRPGKAHGRWHAGHGLLRIDGRLALADRRATPRRRSSLGAGVPTVVGTGVKYFASGLPRPHAKQAGAHGLMVIPRVLSRGTFLPPNASFLGHSGCGILCPPSFTTALITGSRPRPICSSIYEGITRI